MFGAKSGKHITLYTIKNQTIDEPRNPSYMDDLGSNISVSTHGRLADADYRIGEKEEIQNVPVKRFLYGTNAVKIGNRESERDRGGSGYY